MSSPTAQRVRRVDLLVGISYGDDIAQAEKILEAILEEHPKVLNEPEAVVKVHELGDSSVNLIVRPWVARDDYWDVYWDVTREVKLRFDREGISIPFPQRDIHVASGEPHAATTIPFAVGSSGPGAASAPDADG
jgi:small conductance mechanosensitive channel